MLRSILAPNPSPMTLDGTRTFIVGAAQPAVIDPGPAIESHLDAIIQALAGAQPIILLTHSHGDHADAATPLAERTGGRIIGFPDGMAESPIETDAGPLHVLETPGHTPDHLSFRWPAEDALFVGDAFMGGLDTVLIAAPEGDLAAYLRTLDLVEALAPATLYPTHGEPISDGGAAARRYRAHQLERIDQVVSALRGRGPSHPDDLVDAIYGTDLHPELRWAASASIQATADYLARSQRARIIAGTIALI